MHTFYLFSFSNLSKEKELVQSKYTTTPWGEKWHSSIEWRWQRNKRKNQKDQERNNRIGDARASYVTGRIYRKTFVSRLLLYASTILARFIAHSDTFLLDRNGWRKAEQKGWRDEWTKRLPFWPKERRRRKVTRGMAIVVRHG